MSLQPAGLPVQATAPGATMVIYHRRRGVELAMVVFACLIGLGGWLLTGLNMTGEVPANWPWVCGLWLGMAVACHLLIRWRTPYADPLILPLVICLNGLGLAMIHRIDLIPRVPKDDAWTQFIWTGLGMLLFALVLILFRNVRVFDRYPYLLFLAGVALLLSPLLPGVGREINGSRIWIGIGPFSFQPSEAAKILLVVAFASYLAGNRALLASYREEVAPWKKWRVPGLNRLPGLQIPPGRVLGPILAMLLVSLLIMMAQRDLGTTLLFYGLAVVMLYVATERPAWAILGLLAFFAGALAIYPFFSHLKVRVDAWLHPFENVDQNSQVINAQYGFAWGGLTGRGWGLGRPGLTYLSKSDFIAGAIGEELGITGLMAIILIYGIIVARGLRMALAVHDEFTKLVASGLAFVFALQVFAIIGGVTRLLPLTGLTTPFMSQGGSSMVANWVIVGLFVVISHQARRPIELVKPDVDLRPEDMADIKTQVIRKVVPS